MKFHTLLLFTIILTASCSRHDNTDESQIDVPILSDDRLREIADSLAQTVILVDTHVDVPYRLDEENIDIHGPQLNVIVHSDAGDFDYERAKRGGLNAPFMSVYIPADYQEKSDKGKALADSLIDLVRYITDNLPDKFALAGTPAEVEQNFSRGLISLPMGMENGTPIGQSLNNVKYFYDRGIRYITLTHAKDNQICDSSYDTMNTWNGLSPFGEEVVREMNRVGIMVDISHVSDSAFYDVLKIVKAPVIASHSSCRYFTPGFQRNMSDDMIRELGKNGGVIQINFGASFLDSIARENETLLDSLTEVLKEQHLTSRDAAAQQIIAGTGKDPRELYSDVERVADHIDRVVALIGVDHVGIGSDFDGVGDTLPIGLKDVSQYPNLLFVLLKRGYTPEDIEKICYRNIFRVWNEVTSQAQHN